MIQYQKLFTYDVRFGQNRKKMCHFRGLTESKSDDENVRQSAIFYQILPKFELNQGLCNTYSMATIKINVPKFEGNRERTIWKWQFSQLKWPPNGHFVSDFAQYRTRPRFYVHIAINQIRSWSVKKWSLYRVHKINCRCTDARQTTTQPSRVQL